MRSLLAFIVVFISVLFLGALFAYPLYLLARQFGASDYPAVIIISTQICGLVFALVYLHRSDGLSLETLGLKIRPDNYLPEFGWGLLSGFVMLAVLATGLTGFGIYGPHDARQIDTSVIAQLLLGAMLTGVVVAVFEEILFRGALLQGLRRRTSSNTALITISLLYAAVHFIHYPQPAAGEQVAWLTAPLLFFPAYSSLFTIGTLDAFLSLFVLGLLLGMIRIRTGNIIQCIGLHAGLVAGIKLFRFFTEYRPESSYDFLVSSHDLRLGWLALAWLLIVTAGYFFYLHRKPALG